MKSRARIGGHPLHPMLIPYPFAFLSGGALFDVAGAILDRGDLHLVAYYIVGAGIVMAVVAAIPGAIDYFAAVPDGSPRRHARRHAIANLLAVALFTAAWWLRGGPGVAPEWVLLGVEIAALALLGIGGWLGGSLVYHHRIGIDDGV